MSSSVRAIQMAEPTRVPGPGRPGSPIRLERRGTHELKGVPGPWEIFAVTG